MRVVFAGLLVAAIALFGTPADAQGLVPELDLSSPAATLQTFASETRRIEGLYAAYRDAPSISNAIPLGHAMLRLGTHVFDLRGAPPATRAKTGAYAIGYLADIMNRLPQAVPDSAPAVGAGGTAALPEHWTIPGTEMRLIRLPDGPRAGDYVVSAPTLERLPEFHAAIAREPARRPSGIGDWHTAQQRFTGPLLAAVPLGDLPPGLQTPVFGSPAWKLMLALLVILLVVSAFAGWTALVRRWAAAASPWRARALWLTVPGVLALLVSLGHWFNAWQVNLSVELADAETILATLVLFAASAWAAYGVCWLLAETIIVSPAFPDNIYDAHLIRIAARVASLLAVSGIVVYAANDVGVPLLGLVAGVSIGGIALALAAQSTVENLFGGVTIFADRPFRIGDAIRYGGNAGTVELVGPRSTRIRGADGTLTTVPNGDLAKAQVTNMSARTKTMFVNRFGLPAANTSGQVEALLAELRRRVAANPWVESGPGTPRVRLVAFDATTIEVETVANILTTDNAEFLAVQEALILDIMRGVEACRMQLLSAGTDPGAGAAAAGPP